jgi:diadenosine tetraphosphate (Ap4A) HIT family hydrolase
MANNKEVRMKACMACRLTNGELPLPGGRIYQSAYWVVEHCVGPLGVGTLILKPLRHCTHVAGLTAEEAAELGPLLRKFTRLIEEMLNPEQVYVCLWSHMDWQPQHIHFVLQPIAEKLRGAFDEGGPSLQAEMGRRAEYPDPAEIQVFCDRLRERLE